MFFVIRCARANDGSAVKSVYDYSTEKDAMRGYYTKCAADVVDSTFASCVDMVIDDKGVVCAKKVFTVEVVNDGNNDY